MHMNYLVANHSHLTPSTPSFFVVISSRFPLGWHLLGPAIFVWGGATSSIFVDEFGLSESGAAATLALTSISVPAFYAGFGAFMASSGLSGLYEEVRNDAPVDCM